MFLTTFPLRFHLFTFLNTEFIYFFIENKAKNETLLMERDSQDCAALERRRNKKVLNNFKFHADFLFIFVFFHFWKSFSDNDTTRCSLIILHLNYAATCKQLRFRKLGCRRCDRFNVALKMCTFPRHWKRFVSYN